MSERCGFVTTIGIAAGAGKFGISSLVTGRLYNALCIIVTLRSNSDITLQKHSADRALDTGSITRLGTGGCYVRNILVSMTKSNEHNVCVIGHKLLCILVKEPLTASTNVILFITVLLTGRRICKEMGHILVLVSKLGRDNVFANRTKLSVLLGCFLSGRVRLYLIASAANETNVIMSLLCPLVTRAKGMAECGNVGGLNVCTKRTGSLSVAARFTGRCYGLADVLVSELLLGHDILVVAVDTAVNRASLAMAGRSRIGGENVIVSGRGNNGFKRGIAIRAGIFDHTVILTGGRLGYLADPLVTKCRGSLNYLVTA